MCRSAPFAGYIAMIGLSLTERYTLCVIFKPNAGGTMFALSQ